MGLSITTDNDGYIIFTGTFQKKIYINDRLIKSNGGYDIFLTKMKTSINITH